MTFCIGADDKKKKKKHFLQHTVGTPDKRQSVLSSTAWQIIYHLLTARSAVSNSESDFQTDGQLKSMFEEMLCLQEIYEEQEHFIQSYFDA